MRVWPPKTLSRYCDVTKIITTKCESKGITAGITLKKHFQKGKKKKALKCLPGPQRCKDASHCTLFCFCSCSPISSKSRMMEGERGGKWVLTWYLIWPVTVIPQFFETKSRELRQCFDCLVSIFDFTLHPADVPVRLTQETAVAKVATLLPVGYQYQFPSWCSMYNH